MSSHSSSQLSPPSPTNPCLSPSPRTNNPFTPARTPPHPHPASYSFQSTSSSRGQPLTSPESPFMQGRLTPDFELQPPAGVWDVVPGRERRRDGSSRDGGTPDCAGEMGRLSIGSDARVEFMEKVREVICEEVARALRAQEVQLFLRANDALHPAPTPQLLTSSSPPPTGDPALDYFLAVFPELPPSPPPLPSPSPLASTPTDGSTIADLTNRTTSLLSWRLKRIVEEEVEKGESSWRQEKRRGGEEFGALERECANEGQKREESERKLQEMLGGGSQGQLQEAVNEDLKTQLASERRSHNEVLESASSTATLLQERIEILQAALNDAPPPPSEQADDEESIWREIVDSQSEVLASHSTALSALSPSLTCPICTELFKEATTLACGHSGCGACLEDWFARGKRSCPECRREVEGRLGPAWALREVVKGLTGIGLREE